eukprot:scaffold50138_cov61-Phaeocystis_antarctica.AAC.2
MTARRIRAHSGSASVQPVTPFGSDVQNERKGPALSRWLNRARRTRDTPAAESGSCASFRRSLSSVKRAECPVAKGGETQTGLKHAIRCVVRCCHVVALLGPGARSRG